MASKFIKKFKIPKHFDDILSDFAKEILRNQPKDIIDFGIEYFKGVEKSGKFKYIELEKNSPENYNIPKTKKPDIINAPNNIEISTGDRKRIQHPIDNSRYGGTDANEEHKKDYGDWFTKHSQDKQVIDYKREKEETNENVKRNEMGYNTWFNNHSERSIDKSPSGSGELKGYDEWFTRHSQDKLVIDYKRKKEETDENVKRNEMGYNTWFNNHSEGSIDQNQSGEKREEGYDGWFARHSKDKLVIDYKKEKRVYDSPVRCEVDYGTWFENHSKMTNKLS